MGVMTGILAYYEVSGLLTLVIAMMSVGDWLAHQISKQFAPQK